MTGDTCIIKNPLQRNGTSQRERLLNALLPSFVKVDERKTEDLLVYATQLAEQINFFNLNNQEEGTWTDFFQNDISTIVSFIAVKDVNDINSAYQQLLQTFNTNSTKANYKALFDNIISLGLEIGNWYLRAASGLTIKSDLLKFIQGSLKAELVQLIAYDKAAESLFPPDQFNSIQKPKYEKFSAVWLLDIDAIAPDFSIYIGVTDNDKRKKAATFITGIFESFYKVEKYTIDKADAYLSETLQNISDHAPHVGLFITFIQIFKNAQDHINTLTERHLDFFYEEVLRLLPKEAVSDQVNVIFELAKNIDSHLLAQGTLLNAGKDSTNTDIVFSLNDEIVVNKTQIGSLRTSFYKIPANQLKLSSSPQYLPLKNILIAPVANSQDGMGKPLNAGQSWATLGEDQDKLATGSSTTMIEANVGFAIASPILLLNDGIRIIDISLTFDKVLVYTIPNSEFLINLKNNIRFFLTGPSGYIETKAYSISLTTVGGTFTQLLFTIQLDLDQDAVVNYNEAIHQDGFNTPWPMVKMLLSNYDHIFTSVDGVNDFSSGNSYHLGDYVIFRQALYKCLDNTSSSPDDSPSLWSEFDTFEDFYEDYYTANLVVPSQEDRTTAVKAMIATIPMFNAYDMLRNLQLINANIQVNVSGSKLLVLQSDTAIIDPNKPFKPLGVTPSVESTFLIGSKEIFSKQLDNVIIHVEWQDLPFTSMKSYYDQYDSDNDIDLNNESFNVDFEVLSDRKWETPDEDGNALNLPLFDTLLPSGNVATQRDLVIGELARFRRDPYLADIENFTLSTKRGFARLVLKHTLNTTEGQAIIEAFGHKEYPNILTDRVIAKNQSGSVVLPKAPYTPVIKSISIDYSSEISIPLNVSSTERDFNNRIEQFYSIDLFGFKEINPFTDLGAMYLLPQINDEGALFIGISDLNAPQNISFYLQLADGTANLNVAAPDLKFSILSANVWQELPTSAISLDSTDGLLRSGIIKIDVPQNISNGNTLINDGRSLYWIKVHVDENSDAIDRTFQINTQGITASFVNNNNDLNRLRTPLPANSITKLRFGDATIKNVSQPFSSFGGKVKEEDNDFYTRVSERLRHKQRAVDIYDYERLALENYPAVYRVKCLNHTKPIQLAVDPADINSDGSINSLSVIPSDAELSPGYVTMVLIADVVNQNAQDKLVPRVSLDTITSMKNFLTQYNSTFVTLGVENPIYEQLLLKFDVAFTEGLDRKFYTSILNEDIKNFLSPWASQTADTLDISFGGRIHQSILINFIQDRPYVKIVSRFFLFQQLLNGTVTNNPDDTTAIEEAVAHTSRSILVSAPVHLISAIDYDDAARECDAGGIGDMMIRTDDANPASGSFVIR